MRYRHILVIPGLAFLLSACVFYPKKVEIYDADCRITTKELVLEVYIPNKLGCEGASAEACLAGMVAIGPLTAAVSGSIVVAGNTLLWLEKQGRCMFRTPAGP